MAGEPRGGARSAAKPRAKAAAAAPRGKTAPGAANGVPRVHISPRLILAAAAGVFFLAGAGVLATGHRGEKLLATVGMGVDSSFGSAGFRLREVHVQGASPLATADIVKAAGVYQNQPLLGLDLDGLRGKVEKVGWVKEARIVRLLPDTLVIAVDERRQQAVWQHNGRQVVIDDKGVVIPEADPNRFTSLPLVVGEGAAVHAAEILPLVAQRPKLIERMEALVRVDDRRWDLRLKDGSLIQLPAAAEEEALAQLERLDARSRILELGFERIDLRNPDVVAVRPRAPQTPVSSGELLAAGV